MTQTGAAVLLAGSDPDPGAIAGESLESALTGYTVAVEPDFKAAIDLVTDGGIPCAVASHDPDGFDGLAFLEAVRKSNPGFPVILVPTTNDPEVARRAVEAGVRSYIPRTHPDAFEAVVEAVDTICAETPASLQLDRIEEERSSLREELHVLKRTVDAAPIGITITATGGPDNPIVYANSHFEELTGYDRDELLGVNCRFLQGRKTDPERVGELRSAIEADEPVTVALRNYRKDGSEFWNRLTVEPIRNAEGVVTHFAGFQREVSPAAVRGDGDAESSRESPGELVGAGPEE